MGVVGVAGVGESGVVESWRQRLQNPEARDLGHRGRAGRDVELRQRVRHMTMDCVLADEQALGDGVVAETDRDEFKHLELTHVSIRRAPHDAGPEPAAEPEPDY